MSQPRIQPIRPADWNDEIQDALAAFPSGLQFILSFWQEKGIIAPGSHMLGTCAHHPPAANAFLTFNNHTGAGCTLGQREREILVLRTVWLNKCEYEFVQHLPLGKRAGLSDEELERIQSGPDASGWTEADADLLRAVDQLHSARRINDETWNRLATYHNKQQLLDLLYVVGCYTTVSMLQNSLAMELEPGITPLDPQVRDRMMAQ